MNTHPPPAALPLVRSFPDGLRVCVEDAGLNATAPPVQRWIDGWLLRTWPGAARRSRCVNALAAGSLPLEERLALARSHCQRDGVPLIFRITPFTQPAALEDALREHDFVPVDPSLVMVADTLPASPVTGTASWTLHTVPDAAHFADWVGELRGTAGPLRQAHAQRLAQAATPHVGMALRETDTGRLLACGQVAVDGGLAGLYDVVVAPPDRGRGLARPLCSALLAHGARLGAHTAYLQVDAANPPALATYRGLGFVEAYRYHYLETRPADPP